MVYGSLRSGPQERAAGCARWRRRLFLGVVVGQASVFVPVTRSLPAAAVAPQPPIVLFDSLVVTPRAFSPNGDSIQDDVRISYRLRETTTVNIFVTPRASVGVVRRLVTDVSQNPGLHTQLSWNGRDDSLLVVPDGDYEIHLDGVAVASGARIVNQRQVHVDTQPAVATIDSILPPVYTPTVAGTPSPPRIGVLITGSEPGDSLRVRLRVAATTPAVTYRLRLQQNRQDLQGDGIYWAVCDSCVSSRAVPDGIHAIEAATSDAAGNRFDAAPSVIDKDIRGPHPTIQHPTPGTRTHVQRADSLVGTAYDRHGVAALRITVGTDTVPLAVTGGVPPGDSVYVFRADVSSRLVAEGRYPLHLTAVDGHGVPDQSTYDFVVDRTPPAKPELDPRPGPVSKTEEIDVHLRVDPADRVWQVVRTGGALPADTTRAPASGVAQLRVLLRPGINPLTFATRDSALNVSPPETLTVVWETSRGFAAPERFHAGNTIQLHMGAEAGDGVELRIYATDGSLVQQFEDTSRKLVYAFTWNLENPQGLRVKNGAYLLQARVRNPNGSVERWRKLIAVLE